MFPPEVARFGTPFIRDDIGCRMPSGRAATLRPCAESWSFLSSSPPDSPPDSSPAARRSRRWRATQSGSTSKRRARRSTTPTGSTQALLDQGEISAEQADAARDELVASLEGLAANVDGQLGDLIRSGATQIGGMTDLQAPETVEAIEQLKDSASAFCG